MDERTLLRQVRMEAGRRPVGSTRRHRDGELLAPPVALQVIKHGGAGYRLTYLDRRGAEQTDTYHATPGCALDQAELEFRAGRDEWEVVNEEDTA